MELELLEHEFENFFASLKKQQLSNTEIESICKPLYDYQRKESWKKWSILILSISLPYALFQWSDTFNWFLSAVGRLILIQLLPYWNWASLYNAKCLIDRPMNLNNDKQKTSIGTTITTNFETEKANCLLCDNIDFIPTVTNTTFSMLESVYLEQGLPVVIRDSHNVVTSMNFFLSVFDNSWDFLKSSPCDVSTNLILQKFFDVEIVLRKAWKSEPSAKWFLQLRNCQFKAVKSSRNFVKRPYYYPLHLEPFYSSWLIISQNFNHRQYQEIHVQGLIILQQLSGSLDLRLMPKKPCEDDCPLVNIELNEGEGLVFSTDLWVLNYKFVKTIRRSITTIMEIDWNV